MAAARICATVTAPTMAELRRLRDEVADADLVELRLDEAADPDVAAALNGCRLPAVVSCRPSWAGGAFRGSEEERRSILSQAVDCGAAFVELEWNAGLDDVAAKAGMGRVVLSSLEVPRSTAELGGRLEAMRRAAPGAFLKQVVPATRLADTIPLVEVSHHAAAQGPIVLLATGERGLVTRVAPRRFHSEWACVGGDPELAWMSPHVLATRYRVRAQTEAAAFYGLLGHATAYSLSPSMHNAAFGATGRDAVYMPIPAVDMADFDAFAEAFDLRGASVTIPFKLPALERANGVDALTASVGAVNTLTRRPDGSWRGGNSDVAGFLAPLEGYGLSAGTRASILGTGGAARAVAVALESRGALVTVHGRRIDAAYKVAALVNGEVGPWPPTPGSWDVLVNCTPVGTHPRSEDSPMPAGSIHGGLVYDLIYNPPQTRLLRDAEHAGCTTIGGLAMLVAQAEVQFEGWTGWRAPAGVMLEAARTTLAAFATGARPQGAAPQGGTHTR